ncbi:hypothetical protein M9H77_27887 [Catharanthus roseus]|uniref:Uncharacterized protein n=1 Tax=Catharanthus roseus TaxID=4058 RepID=A0ACC0AE60_CATRO|nr:hypothetical protein M9H77_27887 [Catharanthus roseus]
MASSYVVSDNIVNNKVIIIMGATGTGKSRLSIDLATRSYLERLGVPHHLLGQVEQDVDYTSVDFCRDTIAIIETILKSNRVPIIVGGSNSFLEALVEDSVSNFKSSFECCFIWMDVSFPVLDSYVSKRNTDDNRGVRRAIGVPEMHEYFLLEEKLDKTRKDALLASSIEKIKENTCSLTRNQIGWDIDRFAATSVLEKTGEKANSAWNEVVLKPCMELVTQFLSKGKKDIA